MRIYAEQTINLFQTGMRGIGTNRNHGICQGQSGQGQPSGAARQDMAVISPQGKSAGLLANLMNQKELIQANKDSLIEMTLDEENTGGSAGLQEQLEEYEKQLDSLDKQIAAEMAKQVEGTEDTGKNSLLEQNPMDTKGTESGDDSLARLTEQAADFDRVQTMQQADVRREGEKRVCEAEIKLGSQVAVRKLEKAEQMEGLTSQIKSLLRR